MRIKGRRAVVTGASSGVGRAVVLRLARLGADVALVARREAELEAAAREVRDRGGRALVVTCDVSDGDAVKRAYARIVRELGTPDILVNAAGFGVWKPFLEITEEEHQRMMGVMYWGAFRWIRAALPDMIARGRGRIVNVSAGSGLFATPVTSGYGAAARAVAGLSEALHRELLGRPVGVSCVFPGSVRTAFWDPERQPPAGIPPLVRYAPKLSPEAVARNVCYCIWLGLAARTLPVFVALLARANALWVRLGDLILWKWFLPLLVALIALQLALR